MDSIDYQIIKILQDNGRIPVKKLAEIVSLTPPAVAERIRKLEDSGVIIGYKAIVDYKKLGKSIKAIIIVTMTPDKRKEFIEFARENDCILECHHVTGGFSMSIKAVFRDMTELEALVGKIQQYGNTQTLIVLSSPIEFKSII
ncbi:MAG TPA: Lrp/AsnC family transcriptional regulator [Clostridiaceae bacterium]|nr:Lrp/AsnC family transcriptional regulator [Clostridiaceae bacterium]